MGDLIVDRARVCYRSPQRLPSTLLSLSETPGPATTQPVFIPWPETWLSRMVLFLAGAGRAAARPRSSKGFLAITPSRLNPGHRGYFADA